eukprot:7564432-Lingulodinium_polyedra.AAC.1
MADEGRLGPPAARGKRASRATQQRTAGGRCYSPWVDCHAAGSLAWLAQTRSSTLRCLQPHAPPRSCGRTR